jgi:hypothetical protein
MTRLPGLGGAAEGARFYDWIFGAAKNNLKTVELPIHYVERTAGVTKMTKRFRNGLTIAHMCWVAMRKLKMA